MIYRYIICNKIFVHYSNNTVFSHVNYWKHLQESSLSLFLSFPSDIYPCGDVLTFFPIGSMLLWINCAIFYPVFIPAPVSEYCVSRSRDKRSDAADILYFSLTMHNNGSGNIGDKRDRLWKSSFRRQGAQENVSWKHGRRLGKRSKL